MDQIVADGTSENKFEWMVDYLQAFTKMSKFHSLWAVAFSVNLCDKTLKFDHKDSLGIHKVNQEYLSSGTACFRKSETQKSAS